MTEPSWVRLRMLRDTLLDVPFHPLPAGYRLRTYRPGDEQHWVSIVDAADVYQPITLETFERAFAGNLKALSQRQFFLCTDDWQPIGTATAWFGDEPDVTPAEGRVHYVAILPAWQGRGLSKPLLTAVCERLRTLRHRRAYLNTESVRHRAIRLYLQFGFRPWVRNAEQAEAWRRLRSEGLPVPD